MVQLKQAKRGPGMATLLQTMTADRAASREQLRMTVRAQLHAALSDLLPDTPVTLFGSLAAAGRFTESSDVDLALQSEPKGLSVYQLIAQLSERLGRRVDVVLLPECRFREKIVREGETWTPAA
jgi:predicted nucleotidyltransferase